MAESPEETYYSDGCSRLGDSDGNWDTLARSCTSRRGLGSNTRRCWVDSDIAGGGGCSSKSSG
jgi:hypothetical protein